MRLVEQRCLDVRDTLVVTEQAGGVGVWDSRL
jgi:hypothetical protein